MARASGSGFKQGKVSNTNGARGKGGAAGSGRLPAKPGKFSVETPKRGDKFGSGDNTRKMSLKGKNSLRQTKKLLG